LWELQDDFSNLDQVIVALASGRDYLANVDFAVIPHDSVSQCGVLKKTKGSSPYLAANEDWHFHLTEISISRLTKLAEAICASERKRIGQKRVEALLQRAFIDKLIDISVMKDSLRQKVVNAVR